jgi:hypothetical protein
MRTNVVFFATPVSSAAFLRIAPSISSVVLMHINMPYLYAIVKPVQQPRCFGKPLRLHAASYRAPPLTQRLVRATIRRSFMLRENENTETRLCQKPPNNPICPPST